MYQIFTVLLPLIMIGAINTSNTASAATQDREVTISVNDAYIPGGFDSKSDAFVVVNGIFQNGCYNWKGADVNIDSTKNLVEIESKATLSQQMCIMVLIPFTKEVHIGQLNSGQYTLRFKGADGTYFERSLNIE